MSAQLHRRRFLQTTAAAAAASTACGVFSEIAAAESDSPNEKLNIGIVGVAGRGGGNTRSVASENIAALCDIDEGKLAKAKQNYPKATTYIDWRKLNEDKTIDAVVVSTTDFTHAPCAVMAMLNGKHVFSEKPLGHTVEEARIMGDVYRKTKVATQMGTQIHATDNYRRVVELVQSGAIGPVKEAHVWCNRSIRQQEVPTDTPPVPSGVHWDLWIGPAPYRPYHPSYYPGNLTWNRWWDFGNGVLGDMGSHLIDLPYWALELRHPTSAWAEGPPVNEQLNPPQLKCHWEHPAAEKRPALTVHWYQHYERPESPEGVDLTKWGIGVLFVGETGQLVADYGRRVLLPKEKYADFKPPEPWIAPSPGHHKEWILGCKTGSPTLCNFDYSGALIEHNLLGNVAFRVGQKLEWDAKNLKATNCPAADKYIRKEYRKGWEIKT
jgi:predicted dehydrogenase